MEKQWVILDSIETPDKASDSVDSRGFVARFPAPFITGMEGSDGEPVAITVRFIWWRMNDVIIQPGYSRLTPGNTPKHCLLS